MAQSQPSALLQLPAELRNTIYQLAFTEQNQTISHTGDTSNQLRLVCRQLHKETNWLELHHNNPITFVRQEVHQAGPAQQLAKSPKLGLDRLRTVILTHHTNAKFLNATPRGWNAFSSPLLYLPHIPESAPTLVKLSNICSTHPLMTVRYVLPGFSLCKHHPIPALQFLVKGIFYQYALRKSMPADATHTIPSFEKLYI
jgi:hypothetical protein